MVAEPCCSTRDFEEKLRRDRKKHVQRLKVLEHLQNRVLGEQYLANVTKEYLRQQVVIYLRKKIEKRIKSAAVKRLKRVIHQILQKCAQNKKSVRQRIFTTTP